MISWLCTVSSRFWVNQSDRSLHVTHYKKRVESVNVCSWWWERIRSTEDEYEWGSCLWCNLQKKVTFMQVSKIKKGSYTVKPRACVQLKSHDMFADSAQPRHRSLVARPFYTSWGWGLIMRLHVKDPDSPLSSCQSCHKHTHQSAPCPEDPDSPGSFCWSSWGHKYQPAPLPEYLDSSGYSCLSWHGYTHTNQHHDGRIAIFQDHPVCPNTGGHTPTSTVSEGSWLCRLLLSVQTWIHTLA